MRSFLLFLLVCLPFFAPAQLLETFSDGDFTANPAWAGDVSLFTVNTAQQLQSNGPAVTATGYLATASQVNTGAEWEFWVNLKFATSSGNLAEVYLMSDAPNLAGSLNGYFVRIGDTQDEVSLYRKTGTTATKIIDGVDGTISSTTNNLVKVKVSRSTANLWSLEIDVSGTGNSYVSQGTVTDATHQRSEFFGVFTRYSSANSTKFYFDDLRITDATAPVLLAATRVSGTQLDLLFNEPVNLSSAQNVANYAVSGGVGNPVSAVRDAQDFRLVHLTFGSTFPGGNHSVLASNLSDLYGNVAPALTGNFSFSAPVIPALHDVRINELMADYSPAVGLPSAEFVELYNRSGKTFNLQNWKLTDASGVLANFPGYTFPAGSYLILCARADTALFRPFGNVLGLPNFPSLNDAGDDLKLLDNSGKLIDKVTYTSAWYNDPVKAAGGWTLESINPNVPCPAPENWTASNDVSGGTPGRQNSVFSTAPDTQEPTLLNVETLSDSALKLTFSETMDSLTLAAANYTVSGGISVVSKVISGGNFKAVTLNLSPSLTLGTSYTVAVSGAADCAGNVMQPASLTFGIGAKPGFNEVLITEIMADESPVVQSPNALPGFEYLEIFNPTTKTLDLKGLKLSDGGTPAVFPAVNLAPGEYAILVPTSRVAAFQPFGKTIGLSNFPSLNNSGETLSLRSQAGSLIFSLTYSDAWYKDSKKKDGGWSLEMIDATNPCGGINNWMASVSANGGTPGKENSVKASRPDNMAPKLIRAQAISATKTVLFFDEKLDSLTATQASYMIVNGPAVSQVLLVGPEFNAVELTLAQSLTANQVFTVEVRNVRDCNGNLASVLSANFALPVPGQKGDIVINEILFNPRPNGVDFVELLNRSSNYLDLKNWQLANLQNDTISNRKTIGVDYILAPQQLVILTTNPETVRQHYPTHDPNAFLQIPSLPSYNDKDGTVILLHPAGQVMDSLTYTEKMHFELLDEKEGVSLERIRTEGPSERNNFHSAASSVGYATPGKPNSQVQEIGQPASGFTVEPKTFSPDGDGYKDFTTFNFQASRNGQVATIIIYDSQGREMKKLARNQLLAAGNFFQWDGTTNEGRKAPVGYYLVLIEVFDLNGRQQSFKETVAIGAKF
ncbi:lamin tail domain-containing protein [Adhaeribacter sp. BT258]|uniref:Lamin tail domain-containing protein n=1 Tax=Adhaeribacter terrigena TaxID=2793070 RepID=A0ABS1BXB3_9BACT|nr:lamin tail domain-containing protein [Adhaeribacter terrigena]MBK0401541.1 lamin tail domain-containing protein [Adhaeribacter terrigena]